MGNLSDAVWALRLNGGRGKEGAVHAAFVFGGILCLPCSEFFHRPPEVVVHRLRRVVKRISILCSKCGLWSVNWLNWHQLQAYYKCRVSGSAPPAESQCEFEHFQMVPMHMKVEKH